MDASLVDEVWDAVSARVGDDLRTVVRYEATSFEVRMREDLRDEYSAADDQAVVDTTIIHQLSLAEAENEVRTDPLRGLIRVFDDTWMLSRPDSFTAKSGFIVSIQRDGETSSMADVEWCIEYLDEEIAPRLE